MQNWKSPKTQALLFVLTTFVISWLQQYFIIKGDGVQNQVRVFALMWTPGLVGIFFSILFDRNLKPLGLKKPTLNSMLLAYLIPAVTAALIVGLLLAFNVTTFEVSPRAIEKEGSLSSALFKILLLAPTVGMILAFISGFGEEIGWRGFLHSKLDSLTANRRYLLTGIIWSAWHWPLIIFGDYATSDKPFLNVFFFTISGVGLSFLMGKLRDNTGSAFPAALAHGSHNMWILGIAPAFFVKNTQTAYFGGESGLFCTAIYLLMGIFIAKRNRKAKLRSGEALR